MGFYQKLRQRGGGGGDGPTDRQTGRRAYGQAHRQTDKLRKFKKVFTHREKNLT